MSAAPIIFIYFWAVSHLLLVTPTLQEEATTKSRMLSVSHPEARSIILRLNDFFHPREVAYWLNMEPSVVLRINEQSRGSIQGTGRHKERVNRRIRLPRNVERVSHCLFQYFQQNRVLTASVSTSSSSNLPGRAISSISQTSRCACSVDSMFLWLSPPLAISSSMRIVDRARSRHVIASSFPIVTKP